jgi:hypothetical protein
MDAATFAEQGTLARTPTGFVPMGIPAPSSSTGGFSVHPTAGSGFMGDIPTSRFFMPTVQDRILNQLITMTLAPLHGRDMLLTIDLAGQLRRSGANSWGDLQYQNNWRVRAIASYNQKKSVFDSDVVRASEVVFPSSAFDHLVDRVNGFLKKLI